ncbi:MAG TPA: hypothetical protein VFD63_13770 [Pyrinomonadaceae bacterium]|nr:hypothetical protein [Pyrinomonadaceae bacterium]
MLAADSKNYRAEVDLCGPLKLVDDDEGLEALLTLEDDEPPPEPQPLWQQQLAVIYKLNQQCANTRPQSLAC